MIRAALFDVDGIVIVGRKQFFSHVLAERQRVPKESVEKFFLGDFKKCSFGKANLKEVIAPYLSEWKWEGSVEDLLELWFSSESTRDQQVLALVSELRAKGISCYIATRQEKYRLAYLWETVGLKEYFDGAFCTCDIGYDKKEPEFFEEVCKRLQLGPQEIMFFDDSQVNVDTAKALGVQAHFYTGPDLLKEQIAAILPS